MDLIGYVSKITTAAANIDSGRKGFATRGKEQEGRISFRLYAQYAFLYFFYYIFY